MPAGKSTSNKAAMIMNVCYHCDETTNDLNYSKRHTYKCSAGQKYLIKFSCLAQHACYYYYVHTKYEIKWYCTAVLYREERIQCTPLIWDLFIIYFVLRHCENKNTSNFNILE